MQDKPRTSPSSPHAELRISRWPGWIWAVPVAALLIVGWLAIRALANGGTDIAITFASAHGISPGDSKIVYRGVTVGKVTSVSLGKGGRNVVVHANIQEAAENLLTTGTQFWLRGTHPSLTNLSSLGAILSGPTIVMQPGSGKSATRFAGLARKPVVSGDHGKPQTYAVTFEGAVGALSAGDAVKLRGFTVGEVRSVGFGYDARSGALSSPITLALYPSRFHIHHARSPQSDAALRAAVSALIAKGLRARLGRSPPLIGDYRVTLEMVPGAPSASPERLHGLPVIPTAPGGGLDSILSRLNKVPLDQIAQNVLDLTHNADRIVSSPKLHDSVAQLDATLKQIHKTAAKAGPRITRLIHDLRNTAGQLDAAAKAADKSLGGAPSQTGLRQSLREITEAARSVRALANYLDRHPEALVQGRSGG